MPKKQETNAGGWVLSDVRTHRVTESLANKYRDMKSIPRERPLSPIRLQRLYRKISESGSIVFFWASAVCDGVEYRVNGQHSSFLLSTHPNIIDEDMRASCQVYHCENMQAVVDLYQMFDHSDQSRTASDANQAQASIYPELEGVNRRVINLCVTVFAREKWGIRYAHIPKEHRSKLLGDNLDFVRFLQDVRTATKGGWKLLKRGPVVAAMFQTWKKNRRESMKFWCLVASGEGPRADSPDRKLNAYLLSTGVNSGRGKSTKGINGSEPFDVMLARCVTAWNAWRKGGSTSLRVNRIKDRVTNEMTSEVRVPAAV
jgi:hypothetical protein